MGDDDRRPTVVPQDLPQQPAQRGGGGHVEGGHGFVEQKQSWFGGQRAGDGDALRLAARQLGRSPLGEICGTDRLEPPVGRGASSRSGLALASRGVADVGGGAHVREQHCLLRQHRDAASVCGHETSRCSCR